MQRDRSDLRGGQGRDLRPGLRQGQRLPDAAQRDGEALTGAYALGPEAGEWLQQATLAIRARIPLDVLRDTIQPFPTFSEIYVAVLNGLREQITAARQPAAKGRPEAREGSP
ncbi:hypothetical protein [Amycolatopsis sp. NPDC051716]|uniref:hypothetical protein n=1 Tax=Amycolatopsis sp. NPDC051716 TaxID=3155804 RepID=UPI0034186678